MNHYEYEETEGDPFADDENFAEIERRMNINRLKNEISELAGGKVTGSESSNAPSEILEQFWQNVLNFEKAPLTTMQMKLDEAGLTAPPANSLNDEELNKKLWEIIEFLAARQTFLYCTNHLSDRELYTHIYTELLPEETPDLSPESGTRQHWDILGACTEEDTWLNFQYYADEHSRKIWMDQFPDYEMPEHIDPPYDRDRFLPKAHYPHMEIDWDEDEPI